MQDEDHVAKIIRMEAFMHEFNQKVRTLEYEAEDLNGIIKKRDNTISARDSRIEKLEEAAEDAGKDYDNLLKEHEELQNKEPTVEEVAEKPEVEEVEC